MSRRAPTLILVCAVAWGRDTGAAGSPEPADEAPAAAFYEDWKARYLIGGCGADRVYVGATAVALGSGAGLWRAGANARAGQWTVADCHTSEFRKASGGEAFLEWVGEQARVTAGFRVMWERVVERNNVRATGLEQGELQLSTSALVAWRRPLFEFGSGIGFLRYANLNQRRRGALRVGPEWLYLSGSVLDFSPESLGIGVFRMGLGGEIGPVDLFAGLAAQPQLDLRGGVTAGVMFPVAEHFRVRLDALFLDKKAGHASYEAGANGYACNPVAGECSAVSLPSSFSSLND